MGCSEIFINIGISIVASLTIWCFLQLYSVGARRKINHLLIMMRDECIAFEKYVQFNDYDNALQMTRRILDKVCEVFNNIKPLTYISRKKKLLVNTLLSNIYLACHRFTQKHIGYDGEQEKIACCEKTYREIFIVGYVNKSNSTKYPDPSCFEPVTSISAKVLIDLNNYRFKTINKILKEGFFFNSFQIEISVLKKYYNDLIDVNIFKNNITPCIGKIFYLTNNTITKKQYDSIINKLK